MTLKAIVLAMASLCWAIVARADGPGVAELRKCKICHTLEAGGPNRVGPNLHGIYGSKAGTVAGFNFSDAMKTSGIVWDDETLAKFLRDPKQFLPGNRMSFPGIKDEATLDDQLRQLKQATQ